MPLQECRNADPVNGKEIIKTAGFPFDQEVVSIIAAQGKIAQGRVLGKPLGTWLKYCPIGSVIHTCDGWDRLAFLPGNEDDLFKACLFSLMKHSLETAWINSI